MEDFTFPTIAIASPSLLLAPMAAAESAIPSARAESAAGAVDEERMDKLWEDLNENILARAPRCAHRRCNAAASERGVPPAGVGSGGGACVVRRRKLRLLVLLQLVKKLLLLQKRGSPVISPPASRKI